jgi:hypothetical protein
MNWLNIEIKNIRCVDVVGSSPAEVGTWLLAFAYCCEQENSGIICGIKSWKTRQVQRAIGITHSEILQADKLMFYTGDDLTVKFYPIEKQEEVKAKRKAGVERARSRWSGQAGSSAISSADAEVEVEVEVERNEKKKEKPTPAACAVVVPIILNTSLFLTAWEEWKKYRIEKKKKLTPRTESKQLTILAAQPDPVAVIDKSIEMGWTGLYPSKENEAKTPKGAKHESGQFPSDSQVRNL